jgi:hypothetical protein
VKVGEPAKDWFEPDLSHATQPFCITSPGAAKPCIASPHTPRRVVVMQSICSTCTTVASPK